MTNESQFLNLNEAEMLALWKRIARLETVRRECSVERDDGIDLDALLKTHIEQWHAHLLASAPLEWLPVADVKDQVTLAASPDGVVTATLPSSCGRPVEWRLNGWQRSVTAFLQPASREALLQSNKWTRGGACNPAIIDMGNRLLLYSATPGTQPTLATARCVQATSGRYIFSRDALATIPSWEASAVSIL